MRNLKKFLALVLAMVMAFSLMITANAAIDIKDDEINDTFYDAVALLDQMGVFKGDEDGFRPNDTITRGEVAAVIYRIATADTSDWQKDIYKDYNKFLDVHSTEWFAGYVNYCANAEYIKGDGGYFNPYDNITGYEVLAMILRVVGYDQNHEFEGAGWQIRTASIARTEGILKNISEGTLGGYATRQVVAELIFQAIQVPTVSYTFLQNYQKDVLTPASKNPDNGEAVYAEDVYNTILYSSFNVVGQRTVLGADNYGRPVVEWVKDHDDDSIRNGGKFVVNYQQADGDIYCWRDDDSTKGASYTGKDGTGYKYTMKPVKTYYTAIDECTLVQDINSHRAINGAHVVEYLNGGFVKTREDGEALHALHTDDDRYVNAQGRTLEVYQVGADRDSGYFVFVYIDTMMGVVTEVVPHTVDTAGHTMKPSELHVKINDTIGVDVVATNGSKDYTEKVGDLVLIQTYGMKNLTGDPLADDTKLTVANLNKTVPTVKEDFETKSGTWGVDRVGTPTTQTVTVNATTGTVNFKDGVITANGTYKANVVYLANADGDANDFYQGSTDGTTDINTQTTVPAPYNVRMTNERIGQTYTIVLDTKGNVVGMTQDAVKSNIGVITGIDSVRIGTGRYAVEADMVMMDGTKQTVRFLDDETTDGVWDYFPLSAEADLSIGEMNGNADVNVLVEVEPFTKDGATYHKVIATHDGDDFTAADAQTGSVVTGVADTLTGITTYDKDPDAHTDNIDDNTRFIIAEIDYRYNNGTANVGGYTNYNYTFYTGFKNIPTIDGTAADDILWQRIGNNVFIYPDVSNENLVYTMKNKVTQPVDETYLVVAPMATYADHATYKVLKDGVETTLDVVNTNLTAVNNDIETAMKNGQLISVDSRNIKGYVTAVNVYSTAATSAGTAKNPHTRTVDKDVDISFDKTGVLHFSAKVSHTSNEADTSGLDFLTMAEGCTVQIVNLQTGKVYPGTLDSIRQYEDYVGEAGANNSHDFVYELDANGYVSHLYIID